MRRKVLVVAILIFAMLLQCFMPFTTVKAASSVVITLNSKLYAAVKKDLQKQNITAVYQDASGTITITETELSKVTKLDLSEAGIDDLEGLENFSNVSELNLHANNLTIDSKLDVLDSLSLKSLDLSSNKLESIRSISTFDDIDDTDITNQEVVGRKIITVDVSEEATEQTETVEVELPDILLEDVGYMDADWIDRIVVKYEEGGPEIGYEDLSLDKAALVLKVGLREGSTFKARKGLLEVQIEVKDKESKLAGTKMTFYYAVVDQDETGIAFNDENLYKAVKNQLTHNQQINKDLTATNSGNIYSRTYDDALIMVIDSDAVLNNIPTLILNNKKIEDLTGLEEFFGLRSYLNLSYNFIDRIDKIVELEENKKAKEELIREKYRTTLALLKQNVAAYDEQMKIIEEAEKEYNKLLEEYKGIKDGEDDAKKQDNISKRQEQLTKIGEAEEKAKKYENLIYKYVQKLYKIFKNEYRLLTLLPAQTNVLSYQDLLKLKLDEVKGHATSIMERVSKIEQAKALTTYETFAIQKLMGEWGKDHGLNFETQKTEYTAGEEGDESEKQGKKVAIENPISAFFDKVKGDDTLDLEAYQEFVYIFKCIDALSQVEQYTIVNRIFEKGVVTGDDIAEQALEEIKEFLQQEDLDTYFYNMINYKDTLDQNHLDGKQKTDVFAGGGAGDNKGYVLNTKGDIFDLEIGLGETSYKDAFTEDLTKQELILAHRQSVITDEDINTYIVIPRIQNLNLRNNMIEKIDGLETFEQLKVLNLFKNEINDISGINWEGFAKLRALSLGYNQISDIDPLEVIDTLEELDVSYNLLAGRFNFNMSNMKKLWSADFSHNQYTDIKYATSQFILKAKGYDADNDNFADNLTVPEYLEKAGIRLSFQYQSVSLQATIVKTDEEFVYLDLPLIFRQLAEVDYEHTSFGIDSPNGLVESNGKLVKLPVGGEGQYTCRVTVEGNNGYDVKAPSYAPGESSELATGSYSTKGMGYGTTCYITYNVVNSSIIPDDPSNPDNPDTPAQPTGYGFDVVNGDIAVYTPDLSVTQFTNKLIKSGQYKATVTNNNGNGKIATGAKVTVTSSDGKTKYDEFDVVVKGDINGDGKVDRLDSTVIKKAISDVEKLDGVYNSAADVNDDGKINSLDSMLILKYRADRIADFKQQ